MRKGFWAQLKKPIMVLSPMADVTDTAFRQMFVKYGRPSVLYTEFVSCDGLMSPGRDKLLIDLQYSDIERPIVAHIFGSKAENCYKTAQLCVEMGFDGIDINMGCPDKSVNKQGCGIAMIKDPENAKEVIQAVYEGAGDLPVSVKTRIGYSHIQTEEWVNHLLDTPIAALAIHGRTRKEMSKVPAHWDEIGKAVAIRDARKSETLILGNGDITSLQDAHAKVQAYGVDGVLVGRGCFGNPWFFNPDVSKEDLDLQQRLKVLLEHTELFDQHLGVHKNFLIMRKHFASYLFGLPNTKQLKMALMETKDVADVRAVVKEYLK